MDAFDVERGVRCILTPVSSYTDLKTYAEAYSISYATALRMAWDGEIPGVVRLRRSWRVPVSALPGTRGNE
jgi:predicted site-specific integrase-resolvase